jgi:RNase H-fold protein (predicted Holliday junction resolvase)
MGFMYGKWKAVEAAKALRERYGENSTIMERDGLDKKGEIKRKLDVKPQHSFAHLLNKRFKVPVYPVDERFKEKTSSGFGITQAELKRNAERRANK